MYLDITMIWKDDTMYMKIPESISVCIYLHHYDNYLLIVLYFDADKYTESKNVTTEPFFECADGIQVPTEYVCDGLQDCTDFSDELNCSGTGTLYYFEL